MVRQHVIAVDERQKLTAGLGRPHIPCMAETAIGLTDQLEPGVVVHETLGELRAGVGRSVVHQHNV